MKMHSITFLLLLTTGIAFSQVVAIKDIDYIPDAVYENRMDMLDIYMPKGVKDPSVIVYFHGGALLNGDKSEGNDLGNLMAGSGICFVSANYRLSPGVHHPDHVQDAAAATAWVIKNIKEYGGNPEKVYVGGHSAGAYLAALVAIDSSLLEVHEIGDVTIAGAVLISPFLYVEETAKVRIEDDPVYKTIWGTDPESWLQASVTPHIGPIHDNILLIYGNGDDAWRKEQNERFAHVMIEAGNQHIYTHEVPNRTHGSLISAIKDEDDQIVELVKKFVSGN